MAISPAVPLIAVSFAYWKGTDNAAWFPIVFLFGYIFFALLGIPVAVLLARKGRLLSCVIGGALLTLAPILLISALSMSGSAFESETFASYVLLALSGGVGGALFWLIAFAGKKAEEQRR
jgi:hypothetical protein